MLYKYETIYVLSLSDINTFVFAVSRSRFLSLSPIKHIQCNLFSDFSMQINIKAVNIFRSRYHRQWASSIKHYKHFNNRNIHIIVQIRMHICLYFRLIANKIYKDMYVQLNFVMKYVSYTISFVFVFVIVIAFLFALFTFHLYNELYNFWKTIKLKNEMLH